MTGRQENGCRLAPGGNHPAGFKTPWCAWSLGWAETYWIPGTGVRVYLKSTACDEDPENHRARETHSTGGAPHDIPEEARAWRERIAQCRKKTGMDVAVVCCP